MILHANGEGTLELGDIAPLPPPTQAEGGYLIDTGAGGRGGTPTDAFRDELKTGLRSAGGSRPDSFRNRPPDLYGAWCALVLLVPN